MAGLDELWKDKVTGRMSSREANYSNTDKGKTSITVLKQDHWTQRKGLKVFEELDSVKKAEKLSTAAVADFFASAFDPSPEENENPADKTRQKYIGQLRETPQHKQLRKQTVADPALSELASLSMAAAYSKFLGEEPKKEPDESDEKFEFRQEMAMLRANTEAMGEALEAVGQAKDATEALGLTGLPEDQVLEKFKQVRNHAELLKICELAGRYRRIAQSKQRQKVTHGYDDMVGSAPTGELSRLLPSEMALANDEMMELVLFRKLLERQAMGLEYRGSEPVGKGPILFMVDESGSMSGQKIIQAKALALAMIWVASHQKRHCALIAFSDRGKTRTLLMPPGKCQPSELQDWLINFLNGGTEPPLDRVPELLDKLECPRGKTDLIFLTDGEFRIGPKLVEELNAIRKKEPMRIYSILIDCGDDQQIHEFSDQVHVISAAKGFEETVQQIVSI